MELGQIYKFSFHRKIVTQKNLGDQGVCHTKIEKFYRRTRFSQIIQIIGRCLLQGNNVKIMLTILSLQPRPDANPDYNVLADCKKLCYEAGMFCHKLH